MKKIFFTLALFATSLLTNAQITLEHNFPATEFVQVYKNNSNNDQFYIAETIDGNLKIYNSDFTLRKIVNTALQGYSTRLEYIEGNLYNGITKYIFNSDDKYEFLVYYSGDESNNYDSILRLINEDGEILYTFDSGIPNYKYSLYNSIIYYDQITNRNKLKLRFYNTDELYSVFDLPSTELDLDEISNEGELVFHPVPTNSILNIINPRNGSDKVEVYDLVGRKIITENIDSFSDKISLNVKNLKNGVYIFKIGNITSKFIKN